ncbi:tetratricopeptide repeat protein [Acidobacteriota bacterium]
MNAKTEHDIEKSRVGLKARAARIVLPISIAILSLGIYWNSLDNEFVFDDVPIIVENPLVSQAGKTREIFTSNYWAPHTSTNLYRPLTICTLSLNFKMGQLAPFSYHLTNMILHAAASVLVYFCLLILFRSRPAAYAAGLLFAAHPIHVEAVTPAVGRSECLAGALFFGALLAYLASASRRSLPWMAASLILFFAATLSKESALAFPAIVLLCEWIYPRRDGRRRYAGALPFFMLSGVSLALRIAFLGDDFFHSAIAFIDNPAAKLPFIERLFTSVTVMFQYLKLLAVPVKLSADYSFAQVEPVHSFFSEGFLLASALLAGLVAVAFFARHRFPEGLFGLAFMALTYGPASNLLIPSGTIMAERLMYVPSLGFCAIVGGALGRLFLWGGRQGKAATVLSLALVLFLYSAKVMSRNEDFKNNTTLFEKTVVTSPRSAKMQLYYGDLLSKTGRYGEAQRHLDTAIRILPESALTQNLFGAHLGRIGDYERAAGHFRTAVRLNPDHPECHRNLGNAYRFTGRLSDSIAELRRAIELRPHYPEALCDLGLSLLLKGDPVEAERVLKQAVEQRAPYFEAEYNLGRALEAQKRYAEAEGAYRKAWGIHPQRREAGLSLAFTLEAQGRRMEAVEVIRSVLTLKPADFDARMELARLLADSQRTDESLDELRIAATYHPSSPVPWNIMGLVYRNIGDSDRARASWKKALSVDPANPYAIRSLEETGGLE